MGKFKLGLHKEVSSIFTGIAVPGKKSPAPSTPEQVKTDSVESPVAVQPVPQANQAPPVVQTPPAKPAAPLIPTTKTAPAKIVPPAPAVEKTVAPTKVVPPTPAVKKTAAPTKVVSPAPAVKKTAAAAKPAAETPHPFTIPEPPNSTDSEVPESPVYEPPAHHNDAVAPQTKSPVYEPPARNQAVYEPPPVLSAQSSAKQQKIDIIPSAPEKPNPLLKILKPLTDKLLAPKPGVSPARQKATLAIIAILPFVFIFVIAKVFITSDKAGVKPPPKPGAVASVKNQIDWEVPPPLPENFRDPMVFGSSTKTQQDAGPVVKGIVYSEDNPSAVIGDRIVNVGDTVNGAKIVKINPNSVEFAAGDKKWSQEVEH